MSTFINKSDYDANIRKGRLDQLTEFEDTLLDKAETRAIKVVQSYLKSRFDVDAIFAAADDDRDPAILGYTIDLALYYLWRLANPRKVPDYVKEAKDDAIEWLTGVQTGDIVPSGLPIPADKDGSLVNWGSNKRRNNNP